MGKCKYYEEYIWVEPPLEPGENGKVGKDYVCKKATHYLEPICSGNLEECDLELEKILKDKP